MQSKDLLQTLSEAPLSEIYLGREVWEVNDDGQIWHYAISVVAVGPRGLEGWVTKPEWFIKNLLPTGPYHHKLCPKTTFLSREAAVNAVEAMFAERKAELDRQIARVSEALSK